MSPVTDAGHQMTRNWTPPGRHHLHPEWTGGAQFPSPPLSPSRAGSEHVTLSVAAVWSQTPYLPPPSCPGLPSSFSEPPERHPSQNVQMHSAENEDIIRYLDKGARSATFFVTTHNRIVPRLLRKLYPPSHIRSGRQVRSNDVHFQTNFAIVSQ